MTVQKSIAKEKRDENLEVSRFIKILKEFKPILKEKFKVSKIGIFGSFARGEQKQESDIDILVEFSESIGLKIVDLIEFLEDKLGKKIDLVSKDGISPYIKPYIEREVIFI